MSPVLAAAFIAVLMMSGGAQTALAQEARPDAVGGKAEKGKVENGKVETIRARNAQRSPSQPKSSARTEARTPTKIEIKTRTRRGLPQNGAPGAGLLKPAAQAEQQGPPQAKQDAPPLAQQSDAASCLARLSALGLETRPAPAGAGQGASCAIADPVVLTSAHPPGEAKVTFADSPLISCAMAETFGVYVRDIVAPLAKGLYAQPVATIGTGPGFECRTRNHVPGAKISSHAQGNAIDIAQITLGDGAKISIGAPADERARRFIYALRAAGCGAFSTVLGPGSDAAHATHLHFDIEARGRDGKSKFCQ